MAYLRANLHSRTEQRGDYPFTYDFLFISPEVQEKYRKLFTNFKGTVEEAEELARKFNDDIVVIKNGDNLPKEIDVTRLRVIRVDRDTITVKYLE